MQLLAATSFVDMLIISSFCRCQRENEVARFTFSYVGYFTSISSDCCRCRKIYTGQEIMLDNYRLKSFCKNKQSSATIDRRSHRLYKRQNRIK